MKKILAVATCLLSLNIFAVESEVQFENDQVCALKVKIMAHEELGLHRDEYPQIVIALKGGTITRIEPDGTTTDVDFPKGQAVFRQADPADQLHKSINNTCKPIELIIVQLKTHNKK